MRRNLLTFLSVITFAAAAAASETPESPAAKDVEAIERTTMRLTEAVVGMDANLYADQFAEDAVVLPPGRAALRGREAIRAWASGQAATTGVKVEAEAAIDEVRVLGDWAFVLVTGNRTIREGQSEPRSGVVKLLLIHQRQADGSWKIARYMWNSHRAED